MTPNSHVSPRAGLPREFSEVWAALQTSTRTSASSPRWRTARCLSTHGASPTRASTSSGFRPCRRTGCLQPAPRPAASCKLLPAACCCRLLLLHCTAPVAVVHPRRPCLMLAQGKSFGPTRYVPELPQPMCVAQPLPFPTGVGTHVMATCLVRTVRRDILPDTGNDGMLAATAARAPWWPHRPAHCCS